jgi:hypothetical protein
VQGAEYLLFFCMPLMDEIFIYVQGVVHFILLCFGCYLV